MSDEPILEFFVQHEDPFLGTSEVAEFLGFSNPGTQKRLKSLRDDGYLNSKRVGNSIAWWISDEGKTFLETEKE